MMLHYHKVLVDGFAVRAIRFTPDEMEPDRVLRGAAEIFTRARKWGHLPAAMQFDHFFAALERGDDPFVGAAS